MLPQNRHFFTDKQETGSGPYSQVTNFVSTLSCTGKRMHNPQYATTMSRNASNAWHAYTPQQVYVMIGCLQRR